MALEKFKVNNEFIFTDGCAYESVEDLLQSGFLEFCGCGNVEANLLYILGGLEIINDSFRRETYDDRSVRSIAWDIWYAERSKKETKYFGSMGAKYFFYYWADKEGLVEHDGSVPGWLTEKGKELLEMLREYKEKHI